MLPRNDNYYAEHSIETLKKSGITLPLPKIAILFGSGMHLAIEVDKTFYYDQFLDFPKIGVTGHEGTIKLGTIANIPVVILNGRAHVYEKDDTQAMYTILNVLSSLGCEILIQTSAVGSLHWMYPGRIVVVEDHINFPQKSPLTGSIGDKRFVDMSDAYDPKLVQAAIKRAEQLGIAAQTVTYGWMLGPQFETRAEAQMMKKLGANVVGMSVVPETIIAKYLGMKVLTLGMVVNESGTGTNSHEHTLKIVGENNLKMSTLIEGIVQDIST
jgi:purine-nucleoside phosphorylase